MAQYQAGRVTTGNLPYDTVVGFIIVLKNFQEREQNTAGTLLAQCWHV